nr:hlip [Cryptomonas curvata]
MYIVIYNKMICFTFSVSIVSFNNLKIYKNFCKNTKLSLNMNNTDSNNQENVVVLIPGKIKLSELEIKDREKKLKNLSEKWKLERIRKEEYEKKTFGFSINSEILNGRLAMFFLVTGLLTEYWTKQNILEQVETIFRTLGLL